MDTMTAAEAKQKFGLLMDKAQRGPVAITKHGRDVSIVMSSEAYAVQELQRQRWLAERLKISRAQVEAGQAFPAEEVYAEMRNLIKGLSETN